MGGTDLVAHLQPAATLEVLLGDEDLHQALELGAASAVQPGAEGGVARDGTTPFLGEGPLAEFAAAAVAEEVEHGTSLGEIAVGGDLFLAVFGRSRRKSIDRLRVWCLGRLSGPPCGGGVRRV